MGKGPPFVGPDMAPAAAKEAYEDILALVQITHSRRITA